MKENKTINTHEHNNNGQNKCPKCGSSHFDINKNNKIVCSYCKHQLNSNLTQEIVKEAKNLNTKITGLGLIDIKSDSNYITFKCESCGSEIGFNTDETLQKTCPYCRNTLSINMQIPNGAIPDMVLPFSFDKNTATNLIKEYIKNKKTFADKSFIKDFKEENVKGVFLPYIIVDINTSVRLYGQGERQTGITYDRLKKEVLYSADVFYVKREFDLTINDLTIEANTKNLDYQNELETTNILNSIMPFDIENCVKWDSTYLKGHSFEKRDLNIDDLEKIAHGQINDIIRHTINDTVKHLNRGVKFDKIYQNIKGEQWLVAYLPVYLYNHFDKNSNKNHFISVNGRTKETIGSIPLNQKQITLTLLFFTIIISSLAYFLNSIYILILFLPLFYYLINTINKYSNKNTRHKYEKETKTKVSNLIKDDAYVNSKYELRNSKMIGSNNNKIQDHELLIDNLKKQ